MVCIYMFAILCYSFCFIYVCYYDLIATAAWRITFGVQAGVGPTSAQNQIQWTILHGNKLLVFRWLTIRCRQLQVGKL